MLEDEGGRTGEGVWRVPWRCAAKESGKPCEENEEGSFPVADEAVGELGLLLRAEDPEVFTFSANGWLEGPFELCPCEDEGGS